MQKIGVLFFSFQFQGATGLAGERGEQGSDGSAGLKGPVGMNGRAGDPGPAGMRGNQGNRGQEGAKGSRVSIFDEYSYRRGYKYTLHHLLSKHQELAERETCCISTPSFYDI